MKNMKKQVLFWLILAVSLVSCGGNMKQEIKMESEADLAGLRVGTIAGSCYDIDLSERNDIELLRYNNVADALQSLINGNTDVLVDDETVFDTKFRQEYGIKVAHKGQVDFPTAFMFGKDHSDLAVALTNIQQRMIADGTMAELKDFWLTDKYVDVEKYTFTPFETNGEPIRVATAASTAPLSFLADGEWFGLEMDILRELSKELKRPLEIKLYDPAAAILALKTGMVDIACGGIFITPERQEEFTFSASYHAFHNAYFVIDYAAKQQDEGNWKEFKKGIQKNLISENRWKYITMGLWETLRISFFSILFGSILGIGLYAMTRSKQKWIRSLADLYGWFIAGIPELVLLLILFYVVFAKSGLPASTIAVIAFAMCFASGASRIYSTALDAIPKGQTEAGLALGFTRIQTFMNIILPQAIRRGLPLYRGQCISILKGTSIVGYIAIQDLTRAGDIIRSRTYDALVPLVLVTIIYFLLVWAVGMLLSFTTFKKKVL